MASFYAQTGGALPWKTMIGGMEVLATVEEVTINATSEGIKSWGLSKDRGNAFEVNFPNTAFEKYECEKPTKLTFYVGEFAKILSNAEKSDRVILSVEGSLDNGLGIKIENGLKQEYTAHLLESSIIDDGRRVKPSDDVKVKMSREIALNILQKLAKITPEISIVGTTQGSLTFKTRKADETKASISLGNGDGAFVSFQCKKDSSSAYYLEKLVGILKALKPADAITMSFGEKYPLIFEGDLDTVGSKFMYLQAPTIVER